MKLTEKWKEEENLACSPGWDFSHLKGRHTEDKPPWNYTEAVKSYIKPEMKILDTDTGGGEFLLALGHPYNNTAATENYTPNAEICTEKLIPLGIDFKKADARLKLPFDSGTFDIVLSRHGAFNAGEIWRVLKKGGLFITEQVGAENDREFVNLLLGSLPLPYPRQHLSIIKKEFEDYGFRILASDECFLPVRFYDTGALVWFAKKIEWEFPGFSAEKYSDNLFKAEEIIEKNGCIEGTAHRFFLVAGK